jgi:hypothetical protein
MARAARTHGVEIALQLYDLAEQVLRQRLRRESPRRSHKVIEREVNRWRVARPGAENGDAPGRVVAWPRKRSR